MPDPFKGLINKHFINLHVQMITEVIRGCSVPCTLLYGDTKFTECPNCVWSVFNKRSSNVYKADGPIPFTTGVCPYCGGAGRLTETSKEDLDLAVIHDQKGWYPISANIQSPLGVVQTVTLTDGLYDKLRRAKEIITNTEISASTVQKYKRITEPEICSFGHSKFILTMWERIGNG
jgi:hypothetical protein